MATLAPAGRGGRLVREGPNRSEKNIKSKIKNQKAKIKNGNAGRLLLLFSIFDF
jgi:hypothetical protein